MSFIHNVRGIYSKCVHSIGIYFIVLSLEVTLSSEGGLMFVHTTGDFMRFFSEASELDLVLVVVSLAVGFSLVSVMLLLVWLAYRRRAMWPLVSAATPRACCVCPPRQEGDDLILP